MAVQVQSVNTPTEATAALVESDIEPTAVLQAFRNTRVVRTSGVQSSAANNTADVQVASPSLHYAHVLKTKVIYC